MKPNGMPFVALLIGIWLNVGLVNAQDSQIKGRLQLDFPHVPEPKIEVNLSQKLIGLVAKGAKNEPEFAELVGMLKGVFVRVYDATTVDAERLTQHYLDQLKREKWELVAQVKQEEEKIQVRLLLDEDTVYGIFVALANPEEVVVVNIVGEIAPERISDLLENLEKLGLPELDELELESRPRPKTEEAQ